MAELLPITIILPSYNRAHTLRLTLPLYLALPVKEILMVDDGSTDETPQLANGVDDERFVYLRNPRRLNLPATRNAGIAHATQSHILMGEDDVIMDGAYVRRLYAHLLELQADIVAGRLIGLLHGENPEEALARADQEPPQPLIAVEALSGNYSQRLETPVVTPLLHACSLYRRDFGLAHPYDPGYRGNALREESDFYMNARAAGAKLFFCGDAVAYHMYHDYGGGCRGSQWAYAMWGIRNNHRFLGRHWATLREELKLSAPRWRYEGRLGYRHLRNSLAHGLRNSCPRLHAALRRLAGRA